MRLRAGNKIFLGKKFCNEIMNKKTERWKKRLTSIPLRQGNFFIDFVAFLLMGLMCHFFGFLVLDAWIGVSNGAPFEPEPTLITLGQAYIEHLKIFVSFVENQTRIDPLFWENSQKFLDFVQQRESMTESCSQIYAKTQDLEQFKMLSYKYFESIWSQVK